MLPKSYRLPANHRLSRSSSLSFPSFIIKCASGSENTKRFGVIISKKIDKRAVARNRMRRLLHTFIAENEGLFPEGHDFLFIVTSFFDELPVNFKERLEQSFNKI